MIWPKFYPISMRGVLLKFTAVDARLPDNRQQSTFSDFFMIRDGDGNSGLRCLFLHYHMTAALPYFFETMDFQYTTDFSAG